MHFNILSYEFFVLNCNFACIIKCYKRIHCLKSLCVSLEIFILFLFSCDPGFVKPVNNTNICVRAADCSTGPCVNGNCVVKGGTWVCYCFSGWYGERCDLQTAPVIAAAGLGGGEIAAIVIGILIFLCEYDLKIRRFCDFALLP